MMTLLRDESKSDAFIIEPARAFLFYLI